MQESSALKAVERPGIMERAYHLARSGSFRGVQELERKLSREGYDKAAFHLHGALIRRELRLICKAAFEAGMQGRVEVA